MEIIRRLKFLNLNFIGKQLEVTKFGILQKQIGTTLFQTIHGICQKEL